MNGALLINKHAGVSSFGVIELLKDIAKEKLGVKHRDLPQELQKMGHGGTLDPFATGLLIVCMGRGVKLSRYFLGSGKTYEATVRFGETTVSGDLTGEVSARSEVLPESLNQLQTLADQFSKKEYFQTPPMHSAKKRDGKPLYELARQGIEVEREAKLCKLDRFDFQDYKKPEARFSVSCSSGTYIRTLAQDFSALLGTVGMLTTLHRTVSGSFSVENAMSTDQITQAIQAGTAWDALPCFVDFDQLLKGYPRADATHDEAASLARGQQGALFEVLKRAQESTSAKNAYANSAETLSIYFEKKLFAIARQVEGVWGLERVFLTQGPEL
jgi:tRNA pseudouridine55 synthase